MRIRDVKISDDIPGPQHREITLQEQKGKIINNVRRFRKINRKPAPSIKKRMMVRHETSSKITK
jgi:hypothetical protein